jgi:2-polyprenyl-3-methyl-5-hydroxy-6-metoxy-1,4-benzoquinol methylase
MTLSLVALYFLESAQGERLLARLADVDLSETNTLRLLTQVRKEYTAEQAGAALEMARLRLKAVDKFGDDARRLFFTRDALEQASDPLVRRYRANVLTPPPLPDKRAALPVARQAGSGEGGLPSIIAMSIVDAGCGIGADSLAFAQVGADVLGLDIDPVRVAIAQHNAAALGLNARFEVADIRDGLPDADIVFFDPGRRDAQGKRIYDVEQYQPPLSIINGWNHPLIAVKLSPGVELEQLKNYPGLVDFVSVAGDLKEAILWLGDDVKRLRATLLIDSEYYFWQRDAGVISDPVFSPPKGWLVEPDPAILRAGLVQDVAATFNGFMLDETIAYFTADTKPESPWVRVWQINDWMPFNLKKLRAYLRQRNVGKVTVKKRGSPITPEELTAQLKLNGDEIRTLVLTRLEGKPIVMVCEAMPG